MQHELSLDLSDPHVRPYFLWSEDMTIAQLRDVLAGSQGPELRLMYMGRILRECRLADVWHFLTPQEIVASWQPLQRHLGRSKKLWTYLLEVWTRDGLVTWP